MNNIFPHTIKQLSVKTIFHILRSMNSRFQLFRFSKKCFFRPLKCLFESSIDNRTHGKFVILFLYSLLPMFSFATGGLYNSEKKKHFLYFHSSRFFPFIFLLLPKKLSFYNSLSPSHFLFEVSWPFFWPSPGSIILSAALRAITCAELPDLP